MILKIRKKSFAYVPFKERNRALFRNEDGEDNDDNIARKPYK
jgi:hypothetical protein